MVVQVLVSQGNADNALWHEGLYRVLGDLPIAYVIKAGRESGNHLVAFNW